MPSTKPTRKPYRPRLTVKPLNMRDDWYASIQDAESALAIPTDDNALKEYLLENGYRQCAKGQRTTQFCGMVEEARKQAKREALLDVIAEWEKPWGLSDGTPFIDRLRRMAGELK